MSTLDELVPWLREQIAVTRKLARQCIEDDEKASRYNETHIHVTRFNVLYHEDYRGTEAAPEHAALRRMFDPAAVLAQCEAHEAVLDLHPRVVALDSRMSDWCGECSGEERSVASPCPTVRAVALAYRHRPGYHEEWRP